MAVRAHDSGPSTDDDPSRNSSTSTSTVPGMSRSNSLGQQHGGWCTPPRIFVEHQVPSACSCLGISLFYSVTNLHWLQAYPII